MKHFAQIRQRVMGSVRPAMTSLARILLLGVAAPVSISIAAASPGTYTVLHQFVEASDGLQAYGGITSGGDGNFYGTTNVGGANFGGTFFRITPQGTFTVLHSFALTEGAGAYSGVTLGSDGVFSGVAQYGGANSVGSVFRLTASGTLLAHFDFDAPGVNFTNQDGAVSSARLIQGSDGNFYGAMRFSGANNTGTLFRITSAGVLTVLHTFSAGSFANSDGANPVAGLVQAGDGNFYGATMHGGPNGTGTVFQLKPDGTYSVLHAFGAFAKGTRGCGTPDGVYPLADLTLGADGFLYGSTAYCGVNGTGTIFRITTAGQFTTLHAFAPHTAGLPGADINKTNVDGVLPSARLLQGIDGAFYGVTAYGGPGGQGTVFRMTADGTLSVLYYFQSSGSVTRGANPFSPLAQDSSGTLYGTTAAGGTASGGVIFSLTTQ